MFGMLSDAQMYSGSIEENKPFEDRVIIILGTEYT